jgi:hypothetical protein
MKTTALRQKIHSYLAVADDEKVQALYAIMKTDIESTGIVYDDSLKDEVDKRYTEYKNGAIKPVSAKESQERINKLLDTKQKK